MKENGTNVKGWIGLLLGLAALVTILIAALLPMEDLTGFGFDGKVRFYGTINVVICWIGIGLAVTAIVFGALSKNEKNKKGPKNSGIVIGIITTILGLLAALCVGFFSAVTEFINTEGEGGMIAVLVKDNESARKQFDDLIKDLKKASGIKEDSSPESNAENSDAETSVASSEDNSSELSAVEQSNE